MRSTLLESDTVVVERLDLPVIPANGAFEHSPRAQAMFTLCGAFVFETSGARALIDCNQIALIRPELVSRDRSVNDGPVSVLILTPAPAVAERVWSCEPAQLARRRPEFKRLHRTQTTKGTLLSHRLASRALGALAAEECALSLLEIAARTSPTGHQQRTTTDAGCGPGGSRAREVIEQVKEILAARPEHLSVSAIAAEVGLNPVYMTQLFRRHEHVPISVYRSRLRLSRALFLLRDADDLSRLALDLGYGSHSHFTTAFRREYGETPSQYRARLRGSPPIRRSLRQVMASGVNGSR